MLKLYRLKAQIEGYIIEENLMDLLVEKLNDKLHTWDPYISKVVRNYIKEIIELADQDALGLIRSRKTEQEVLDIIDES